MVLGMTIYNMILNDGFSSKFFNNLLNDFWLGFFVALILDIFIVGKIAKPIALKIVKPNENTKPIKIILAISCCMVVGMVLFMSIYGAIVAAGFNSTALKIYPLCIARNFIMALPLNLLIVSPLVRISFNKIFSI
jgi:membrane-bound acyltransferase YfiQ involved in biofilm formation